MIRAVGHKHNAPHNCHAHAIGSAKGHCGGACGPHAVRKGHTGAIAGQCADIPVAGRLRAQAHQGAGSGRGAGRARSSAIRMRANGAGGGSVVAGACALCAVGPRGAGAAIGCAASAAKGPKGSRRAGQAGCAGSGPQVRTVGPQGAQRAGGVGACAQGARVRAQGAQRGSHGAKGTVRASRAQHWHARAASVPFRAPQALHFAQAVVVPVCHNDRTSSIHCHSRGT